MSNGDEVVAASIPLELGGVTYRMAPLDDIDIVELDEWVRDQTLVTARRQLGYCRTQQERDEMLSAAFKAAAGLSWMSGEGARLMGTPNGLARLVWQSVRKNHPNVTLEQLRKHMMDRNNVATVNAKFRHANRMSGGAVDSSEKKVAPSTEDASTAP